MNKCANVENLLSGYALGELSEQDGQIVDDHLAGCAKCRTILSRMQDVLMIADSMKTQMVSESAYAHAVKQAQTVSKKNGANIKIHTGWSRIMKSKAAQGAIAAMLIIGAFIFLTQGNRTGLAWGDVVEQIKDFRPYECTRTTYYDGIKQYSARVMHQSLSQRREERDNGDIYIFDMRACPIRTLALNDSQKYARLTTRFDKGPLKDPDFLLIAAHMPAGSAQKLGTMEINGIGVQGFHTANEFNDITIWADVETAVPVKLEVVHPQQGRKIVFENFAFNMHYKDSLFAVAVPRDYDFDSRVSGIEPFLQDGNIAALSSSDQLLLAQAVYESKNVTGLVKLFENGAADTKLAIANYLGDLGTEEAAIALKVMEVSNEDSVLQETIADILENMNIPSPGENAIDPNLPDDVSGETENVDAGNEDKIPVDTNNDQEKYLGIQIIDAVSGKAIEGAVLKMRSNLNDDIERTTNQFGRALYAIDTQKASYLTVKITAKGYVSKYLDWRPASKGIAIPKQYQVQMKKSAPAGGFVKTKEGQPIEGATVNIYTEFTTQYTEIDYIQETVKTDKDGRWYYQDYDPDAKPYMSLSHPDYVSMDKSSIRPNIELLLNQTHVMFMQPGLSVGGHVRTPDGKPIAGAVVYEGWSRFSEDNKSTTDAEGYYEFAKCYEGSLVLTVAAKGYAPDIKEINIHENLDNVDFKLTPGHTLPLRILDLQDNPIEGVKIEARYWRTFNQGQKCESIRCSGTTGADGRVVLEDLPADEVQYSIRKDGYATLNNYPMIPSEEETVVTLWPQGKLTGRVYDAESGEPIHDFTMTEGIHWQGQNKPTWQTHSVKHFDSGRYELPFTYHNEGYAVRIEAKGYQTFDSESVWNEGKDVTLDVYLKNIDGDQMLGVVYDPDGQPAANADVLVALKGGGHWLRIENGRFDQTSHLRLITNPDGEFILPPQQQEYVIIVLHEKGVSRVSEEEFMAASSVIRLEKWGHIEGTVYSGHTPDVNCEISVQSSYDLGFSYEYNIIDYTQIYSDDQGRFSHHRIPPGPVTLAKVVKLDNNSSASAYRTSIKVLPGETKEVHLGGGGRTVTGRLVAPAGISINFTENNSDIMPSMSNLQEKGLDLSVLPEIPIPQDYFLRTQEQMQTWQTEWMQTPDGQEYRELAQKLSGNIGGSIRGDYPIVIDEKGHFEITDVLPGSYTASIRFHDPALTKRTAEYLNTYVASVKFEFTVEETQDKEEFEKPVDIGQFSAQPIQGLKIGLLPPPITVKDLDGKTLSLSNYQGRYLLLDLDGSRYLTDRNQDELETVKQIYSAYHQKGNLEVISVIMGSSFPQNWTSVQRAFRYLFDQKDIRWTVAFENIATFLPSSLHEDYSINGKPARYVLSGPDQKVLEIITDQSELLEKVKKHLDPLAQ